ncbi:hypothetical protein ASG04_08635 [Curtobacterium sp. Leaf183]|nr:hypothetical protein ASG04_08635 [Curtobacterium sp. Leaf183]
MEDQHDTVSGSLADDLHRGDRCPSTFDRWRCGLPAHHGGPHRSCEASQRAEWNDRASGRRLRDLARPAEHAERAARAVSDPS